VKAGDWVRYNDKCNPEICGFVVEVAGSVMVLFITKSPDDPDLVGKRRVVDAAYATVENAELTTGDVSALIDLALQTNDRQWFEELTQRTKALGSVKKHKTAADRRP